MEFKTVLQQLFDPRDLSPETMREVMQTILRGDATPAQIAAFLIALRCKGESVEEIATAAEVLREWLTPVAIEGPHVVDTCGTGGDGAQTFNISTASAFVVAAAGGRVAKHGNRSVSSHCGSADVLEAAGVCIELDAEQVAECIRRLGVGFLFAPHYHAALRHSSAVRRELGVRTLFNLLGPLVNPARAPHQLLGVYAAEWLDPLAHVLRRLGARHALIVHAEDGLDEISLAAPTRVAELHDDLITHYTITPEQFGLERCDLTLITATDATTSLALLRQALSGQPGPARDIVVLNAGAAIYAADLTDSLASGVGMAQVVIDSGAALARFEAFRTLSQRLTAS